MLCHLTEEGRESSYCYWPTEEGAAVSYGSISVTLESTQSFEGYKVRRFNISEKKVGVRNEVVFTTHMELFS